LSRLVSLALSQRILLSPDQPLAKWISYCTSLQEGY
jgi:hypothetical protein